MKYDRPVWQLMHQCADAMPETFRYDDVRAWFTESYPEVGEATIRAHVVGLTEGGAKHPQFQRRSPIFRRVARGQYLPIPFEQRGELPEDDQQPTDEPTVAAGVTPQTDRRKVDGPGPDPDRPLLRRADDFWPFPASDVDPVDDEDEDEDEDEEESGVDDTAAAAAEARRLEREKTAKRERKAAKREAKRLAALEVERARRELVSGQSADPDETRVEPEPAAEAPGISPEMAARLIESGRPAWEIEIENERARLAAARLEATRRETEMEHTRTRAEQEIEAERRRLAAEREEMARIAAERAESRRLAGQEIDAERARLAAERAEADRLMVEQVEARSKDQIAAVRREAERTAVAQREAERLQAERLEAERIAAVEKKRVNKLRKAARKERELAEMLERDRIERKARRKAERRARESAERHLHEAAERRRREDEDRRSAAQAVRDDLARLEADALRRIEADREARSRPDPAATVEHDRDVFEQGEQERRDFERENRERDRLQREEQQLQMTLRPMIDEDPEPTSGARDDDADHRPFDSAGVEAPAAPDSMSHGGIVIVRAPRPEHLADDPENDVDVDVDVEGDVGVEPVTEPPFEVLDPENSAVGRDDESTELRDPSDAIVLGSLGERLGVPAPAKDAYRDLHFQRARRDAERSGARWFVLSAEHGLLEPQEWVSPDDRAISDIDPRHRAVWASWVATRLELLVGDLHGLQVHVDAPDEIAVPVVDALGEAGAQTTTGTAVHAPEPATGPAEPIADEDDAADDAADDDVDEDVVDAPLPETVESGPDAQVLPFQRIGSVADHLVDARNAVPAALAAALPHHPGLYAWTVDHAGSRMLNRALMLPVRAGVIYVGQVGAGTGACDGGFSLNDHVTRVQLHGRARSSTFRMNLATTLSEVLGLHTIEDPRLTQWMLDHLSVTVWPTDDVAGLRELEASVADELRPVLNIEHDRAAEYRRRIADLRGRLA